MRKGVAKVLYKIERRSRCTRVAFVTMLLMKCVHLLKRVHEVVICVRFQYDYNK